jgi:fluoroquinolone transport system permease protein
MRMKNLFVGDVRFQFKYGFYFVYTIFTFIYASLIYVFPHSWKVKAATIMIFSDPAAMGLFFMGAIVLLEKSERVLNSIAVSPVGADEYILSKVISIGFISTVVGLMIAFVADIRNIPMVAFGIFMGSAFFTLVGLIIASNIKSLNQFIVSTVPIEIICFLPPIFYLFGYEKTFMLIHPGCILVRFISGNSDYLLMLTFILLIWIAAAYLIAYKNIKRMLQQTGGAKL